MKKSILIFAAFVGAYWLVQSRILFLVSEDFFFAQNHWLTVASIAFVFGLLPILLAPTGLRATLLLLFQAIVLLACAFVLLGFISNSFSDPEWQLGAVFVFVFPLVFGVVVFIFSAVVRRVVVRTRV